MDAVSNNKLANTENHLKDFLQTVLSSEGIVVDIRRTFIEYNGVNRSRAFARHANRMASKGTDEKFVVIALMCYPALQWILRAQDIDKVIDELREQNADETICRMSNIQRMLESSVGCAKPQLRLEMRKVFFARCQELVDAVDDAMNKAVFLNPQSKPSKISLAMAMMRGSILESDPVSAVAIRNNFDSIVEDVTKVGSSTIKPLVMELAPNEGEAQSAEASFLFHNTVAPAGQFYKPAPAAPAQQTPAPVQPASQPNLYQQPQQATTPAPAPAVNSQPNPTQYPAQQDYAQQLGTALGMDEIDYNAVPPVQPEPEVSQPVAPTKEKKTVFRKGQKPQPAEPAQSVDGFDGAAPMPVAKKKKGKAGIIVAAVLAVAVAGSGLMYAFVPSFYDGVNGVLTSVTGKQVGVPPVATSDDGGSTTTPQTTTQTPAGTGENALDGVDLSGNVSIDFYATVRTADGREYKVPLSTANLSDGVLTSLLDGSGFTLTTNGQ